MSGKPASSAGAVIADAVKRARAHGTSRIGEDHLFAALLGNPGSRPLLDRADGPAGAAEVLAEVRQARRRGGLTVSERDALAGLGINLGEVVARVEAQLGEGALDGNQPLAHRRRVSLSAEVRNVLTQAQRQRAARGDRGLTAGHLVLGLLAQPGLFTDALAARGVTLAGAIAAMSCEDLRQAR